MPRINQYPSIEELSDDVTFVVNDNEGTKNFKLPILENYLRNKNNKFHIIYDENILESKIESVFNEFPFSVPATLLLAFDSNSKELLDFEIKSGTYINIFDSGNGDINDALIFIYSPASEVESKVRDIEKYVKNDRFWDFLNYNINDDTITYAGYKNTNLSLKDRNTTEIKIDSLYIRGGSEIRLHRYIDEYNITTILFDTNVIDEGNYSVYMFSLQNEIMGCIFTNLNTNEQIVKYYTCSMSNVDRISIQSAGISDGMIAKGRA